MTYSTDSMDIPALQHLVELSKLPVPSTFPDPSITLLNLSNCSLNQLPAGFEKALPNLSILFLSNNNFAELPAVIGACPKLQMVAFKSNRMKRIHPDALKPQLRWLILTDNELEELPDTIGRCTKLQKCMLSGNRLRFLPNSMAQNCVNLELIRLASNQLTVPPTALLRLPKLAWVALSDNPFLEAASSRSKNVKLPKLVDIDETAGKVLGQGAGGITRQVDYHGTPVAVKQYGGAMTSDGLPSTERCISGIVGCQLQQQCKALIKVLGETNRGSLVMEFLENMSAIAQPPSMESCSRDVYPAGSTVQLSVMDQVVSIANDLLVALSALHHSGICHGDVYGHNLLVHSEDPTRVRLSDFGAAFFYEPSTEYGRLVQVVELRALAILVDEIVALVEEKQELALLKQLVEQCRSSGATFESVLVWWKQQQLKGLANEFEAKLNEDKEN